MLGEYEKGREIYLKHIKKYISNNIKRVSDFVRMPNSHTFAAENQII